MTAVPSPIDLIDAIEPQLPVNVPRHQVPPLMYGYMALEPCISARTMRVHHDMHHGAYVDALNAATHDVDELKTASALWLLCNLSKIPANIRGAIHHSAGGHVNHGLFWRAMRPGPQSDPTGHLAEALSRDFGSYAAFQKKFEQAGTALFGSGWVWLVRNLQNGDKLEIMTTAGHDHPMMKDRYPLLLNDVWEHAYYLQYESRRAEYLKAWWPVVDWTEAARRFERKDNFAGEQWEAEGGHLL